MDKTKVETPKEVLERVKEESINLGVSVYEDFIYLAHNDYVKINDFGSQIDFKYYGYLEYCLFAECLQLFNNNGYDQLTNIINEIEGVE